MGPQNVLDELSDSDHEELPRFGFLQQQNSNSSIPKNNIIMLESSGSETSHPPSPLRNITYTALEDYAPVKTCAVDVTMISSESEVEEEIVPLSERLKGRFSAAEALSSGSSFPVSTAISSTFRSEHVDEPAETAKASSVARPLQLPFSEKGAVPRAPKERQRKSPIHQSHRSNFIPQPTSLNIGPPKKKVKHSVEELEKGHEEALRKRQEREKLRERKECLEQEKAKKKALAEALKAQRPEECMKHMQVLIDPAVLQMEGGGLLLSALQTMECSCVVNTRPVPYSISWRRRATDLQEEESAWVDDPSLLVLVPQKDFITLIQNSRKEHQSVQEEGLQTLRTFSARLLQRSDEKSTALVVMEMEKYFKCKKSQAQKQLRQAVLGAAAVEEQTKKRRKKGVQETLPVLSRVDVEEALVDIQLHTGIQVRFVETWKEFGEFASMFTKSVAEAPFKRQREETNFSFYLENDWAGGVRVDRCGKGLLQVWKRQLQQFNRVSVEIANAVAAAYPSPQLLAQAYKRCTSTQARHDFLKDILVRRGEGVIATSRRVGPELSKRIYLQMTSINPELSLEVTT
ncbi:structure-specific endonuclease subunit EME1 [Lissotriton helveticus]